MGAMQALNTAVSGLFGGGGNAGKGDLRPLVVQVNLNGRTIADATAKDVEARYL